ncbi:hypothetical protein GSI_05202 [Ganoderma sinense ZZ0214-1]|uniref:DUF6534 domain-containing protein n=1 Tax=Ganoderma sinense ZZ0214-1 TaxID=1077348 RepID=A0A2G8SFE7_9APHY|nr:hypothetical protein GSI_05202 [Ganoderma sinense ZZ0214-1]
MGFSPGGTLGGFFVGFTVSLFLTGMLVAQVGTFYRYHEPKPNAVTALIFVIFILENGHTVFMSIGAWDYMVSLHGNASQFHSPVVALGVLVYIATACNTFCRIIFAYSIYKLNGRRGLFPVIIVASTLIPFSPSGFDHICYFKTCFYVGTAAALTADILITASLVVVFARRGAGFGRHVLFVVSIYLCLILVYRTIKTTVPLLFYCLNTGVASSICVIGVLISYVISPTTFIWMSFYLVLGKVYTNSLLGFLNAREVIFVRGGANRQNMQQTTTAPLFTSIVTIDRSDTPDSQFYIDAAEDDPRGPAPVTTDRDR